MTKHYEKYLNKKRYQFCWANRCTGCRLCSLLSRQSNRQPSHRSEELYQRYGFDTRPKCFSQYPDPVQFGVPIEKLKNINITAAEKLDKCLVTRVCRLTPPLSFFRNAMLGGCLLRRMPNPSSSLSMIFLCCSGLSTSSTIKMRPQVLATAITCLPLPLPSLAPSMMPGKSRSCLK